LLARYSIDIFHFEHHKGRMELKPRILRLLDLEFLAKTMGVPQDARWHIRVSDKSSRCILKCRDAGEESVG
jgi:hypothetical protein